MKKIFKVSLFAVFMGVIACDDATDINQANELPEDMAYRTVGDLNTGLNGVYAAYGPDFGSNGDGDIILFNDLFTDNIKKGFESNGQGNQEYNFILQANSTIALQVWGNRYGVINFANRTLRAWNRIAPELEDESDIADANRIKAELLALRALCHFDLLSYYTVDYENPGSPGVIIMDFVPESIFDTYPRNTVGEVFEFILSDLDEAETLMEVNRNVSETHPFYINDDVINAIRARVLLFQNNAEDYARIEEITESLVAEYPLANPAQYRAMFIDDTNSPENIFTLSRLTGDNGIVSLWAANTPGPDGSPFFEVSNELEDLLDDGDVRRAVIIHPDSEIDESNPFGNRIFVGKYRGRADGQTLNHIKLIRSSEMMLIKAEVEARQSKFTEARESLMTLREERYFSGVTPQAVMDNLDQSLRVILLERRKELAFEGHRYLDLKRIGGEIGVGISRYSADCASFSAPCDLAPNDYRFTLPIPRTEVNANPEIVQNPQY